LALKAPVQIYATYAGAQASRAPEAARENASFLYLNFVSFRYIFNEHCISANSMTPEEEARQKIDELLMHAGWKIQDFHDLDLGAATGVVVREFPL